MTRRLPGRTRLDEALGMAEPKRRRIGDDLSAPRPLVGDGHRERVPSVTIEHTPGDAAREAAALVGMVHRVDALREAPCEGFERVALLLDGRLKAAVSWSHAADRPDAFVRGVADALARAIEAEGTFGGPWARPVGHPPDRIQGGLSGTGGATPHGKSTDGNGSDSDDPVGDSEDLEGPVEAPVDDIGTDGGK